MSGSVDFWKGPSIFLEAVVTNIHSHMALSPEFTGIMCMRMGTREITDYLAKMNKINELLLMEIQLQVPITLGIFP